MGLRMYNVILWPFFFFKHVRQRYLRFKSPLWYGGGSSIRRLMMGCSWTSHVSPCSIVRSVSQRDNTVRIAGPVRSRISSLMGVDGRWSSIISGVDSTRARISWWSIVCGTIEGRRSVTAPFPVHVENMQSKRHLHKILSFASTCVVFLLDIGAGASWLLLAISNSHCDIIGRYYRFVWVTYPGGFRAGSRWQRIERGNAEF